MYNHICTICIIISVLAYIHNMFLSSEVVEGDIPCIISYYQHILDGDAHMLSHNGPVLEPRLKLCHIITNEPIDRISQGVGC